MDVTQIDDVIPKPYQDQIESEITSNQMPWFFLKESGRRTELESNYTGFCNTVYHVEDRMAGPSPMAALLLPLLYTFCDKAKLTFTSLLRVRIGLFPRTMIDVPHHNPHVDFYLPHRVAVYYVNDSDGDTVIFNETSDQVSLAQSIAYTRENKFTVGERVAPKKGRIVSFDGKHYHASMHPRQHASRIAISFSFT